MKFILKLFLIAVILVITSKAYAQYDRVEQTTVFSSQMDSPIKVEVLNNEGKYRFEANNRSLYPYELEIVFDQMYNLSPRITSQKFKLTAGSNHLFTLEVDNPNESPSFNYSIKYSIGHPNENPQLTYPYLIPIKKNGALQKSKKDENVYIKDVFTPVNADTVFCMRKGLVVAVPDFYDNTDRLSQKRSLEIIHSDGTLMIYENIDPTNVIAKKGSTIYPSEPLGCIKANNPLDVQLCLLEGQGKIRRLEIYYYLPNGSKSPFSENFKNIKAIYPDEIIVKEMRKKEIKKYYKSKKK